MCHRILNSVGAHGHFRLEGNMRLLLPRRNARWLGGGGFSVFLGALHRGKKSPGSRVSETASFWERSAQNPRIRLAAPSRGVRRLSNTTGNQHLVRLRDLHTQPPRIEIFLASVNSRTTGGGQEQNFRRRGMYFGYGHNVVLSDAQCTCCRVEQSAIAGTRQQKSVRNR
jgi:hypothetical protein